MTLKRKVTRGLKWQAVRIGGKQVLSLVVFTTLARLLAPEAFGLIALIGVYTYFASMLADSGIGAALIQRKDLEKEHIDTAFWFNLGCNGLLCLMTVVLAGSIAAMMGEPKLAPLLRWASIGLLIGALSSIQATLFLKEMDFRRGVIRTLLGNTIGGAVGVGMALAGLGVWSLIGQLLIGNLAGTIFMCCASAYRPSFAFSPRHLRDLLSVGATVVGNALIGFVSSRLDQLIIGRVLGASTLGLYVISTKIPEMMKATCVRPIIDVSIPALAGLQSDHLKMREAIYRGMELHSVVMFAVFVGIAATAHDLIPFLFGPQWSAAGSLMPLVSLYFLVSALQAFVYPALLATGVTGRYIMFSTAQAVGVAIACLVGAKFGVLYVISGLLINSLVMVFPALLLLRQRIGLSLVRYCKPCIAPACASLFMAAIVWIAGKALPLGTSLPVKLVVEIMLGAGGYVGFIFIFQRRTLATLTQTLRQALGLPNQSRIAAVLS